MMFRNALLTLTCLATGATFAGCMDEAAPTSSGILAQMQTEFQLPVTGAPDIDHDPCIYPVLKKLWRQYAFEMSGESRRYYKFRLLDKYKSVKILPSKRIARVSGKVNVLTCQLGHYVIGDPSEYVDWETTEFCGQKLLDQVDFVYDGENRLPTLLINRDKDLSLSAEDVEFAGDIQIYNVRNLQAEFKAFETIDDPIFRHYLALGPGEMFNPFQPYIRHERPLTGVRCAKDYNGAELNLSDLLGEKPRK